MGWVHPGCRLDSLCIYKRVCCVGRGPTCCTFSSPADLEAVLRLLLLAREQAAEPVVAACLRELHSKVHASGWSATPSQACLRAASMSCMPTVCMVLRMLAFVLC